MITQPSILNGPTVYETGASGGGDELQLNKNKYHVIELSGYKWFVENLDEDIAGINYSTTFSNIPNRCYPNNNSNNAGYGQLYNSACISIIENYVQNITGENWQIPTKEIIDILITDFTQMQLRNKIGWSFNNNGNNESGFSALPAGYYYSNSWSSGDENHILTKTKYNDSYSGQNMYRVLIRNGLFVWNQSQYTGNSIRLCKPL